jgi:hypothetical protein
MNKTVFQGITVQIMQTDRQGPTFTENILRL